MRKTIKETREMIDKVNKFLSEVSYDISGMAAEKFKSIKGKEMDKVLGPDWETQKGAWTDDFDKESWLHDNVWEFCDKFFPEHMGDEEKSEKFVQNVMSHFM